ncbi:uncharacterized protein LAESUDRAFT_720903 [Laetiporus sulphureus 93-53]|uniref:PhoD-like phosphatase domain-containing protein n=1 Tax=Laetiporus sulphureus 93-53 TaxID=1314785 RepID=A0A165HES0_9APHY|nr:uncharacterized protein LAESUDRAFT_720903 [Laetiporus sulphureus 93-53]KZT11642.1 hypothetical protein LAESUDRAFT_720903 [Laetiporus sulphureus 93-53]
MDSAGWHARHRAKKDDEALRFPQRGPDGRYQPREQVYPMEGPFVGGFGIPGASPPGPTPGSYQGGMPMPPGPSPGPVYGGTTPPPIPPRPGSTANKPPLAPRPSDEGPALPFRPGAMPGEKPWTPEKPGAVTDEVAPPLPARPDNRSEQTILTSPESAWSLPSYPDRTSLSRSSSGYSPAYLTKVPAAERTRVLKAGQMEPYLQLMAGPLLRYDTVDTDGVWRGAALIVTADAGSSYDPSPILIYSWDPDQAVELTRSNSQVSTRTLAADLPAHPADPYSIHVPDPADERPSSQAVYKEARGQEIYVYVGNGGTCTFWRFMIEVPLGPNEMRVSYNVNRGQRLHFYVPARNQNMRWAAYSCNGFSAGVNPNDFCGPGFRSGYDPVWTDLLAKHSERPFHTLVGGGDQLYCDAVAREPEMQEWVKLSKPELKKKFKLTEEMRSAIDRFYFNHYCHMFRSGAFARANSSIPMLNMLGVMRFVHALDPDDLMSSEVFSTIGSRGYFFFLLFQCFINFELDGRDVRRHPFKSIIIGGDGPFVRFPSHSFLTYLGPQVWMLLLDCRAERKLYQVCSELEYRLVMEKAYALPGTVEHLVVQLGIPIAYPRMVFLEQMLSSNLNPLVMLGRNGSLGLSSFVNKFNSDAELLDDLNDHWTSKHHKRERNWLVEKLQLFAKARHIRITFLSGDVHCAAVGVFKTLQKSKQPEIPPPSDYRYMLNVVSSAIVNTPPPAGVLTMVSSLATKTHRTMHHMDTDETMVPIFEKEPNGSPAKSKYIMGRRNWCAVRWDQDTGDLVFDIRIEEEKGVGRTVGYAIRSPPPRWL